MSATTEQLTGSIRLTRRSSLALDNLRAFVILLVLSFHSVLAYLQFLPASPYPFDSPPYLWRAIPIVDSHRWLGFDLYCAWQDVFLMSLFFFLSGLFVWPSLDRRGIANFLHGRILRLGLPFVLVVAILMPPTLYPTYLQTAERSECCRLLAALARIAVLAVRTDVVFVAVVGRRLYGSCPASICAGLGQSPDPRLIGRRGPSGPIFCRFRPCLGARLCAIGPRLHSLGLVPAGTVRVPAQPPVALCALFLCRPGAGRRRRRARSARGGRTAGAALAGLDYCRGGLIAHLDGADRAHDGGRRLVLPRFADARRSEFCFRLLCQLLCRAGGRAALHFTTLAVARRAQRQRLRHVSGALPVCRMAAVRAARPRAPGRHQGRRGFRRYPVPQLE